MGRAQYDVAQICLNGHVINSSVKRFPEDNRPFCDSCGMRTITKCQECKSEIPGYQYVPGIISVSPFRTPAFCSNCGAAYPWTESRLQVARELALELEGLAEEERLILEQNLDDIVTDSPRTTLAATKWKLVLSRAGKEAAGIFREVLTDVISETARKIIWP